MKRLELVAAAACLGAPVAFAQTISQPPAPAPEGRHAGLYLMGGMEGLAVGSSPFALDPVFTNLEGRVGYSFNSWLSVEAQASAELYAEQFDSGGNTFNGDNVNMKGAYGAFLAPRLPIGPSFGVYGRIGYVTLDYKYASGYRGTVNGAAFGGGVDFDIGGFTIAADLTTYPDTTASFAVLAGVRF